MDDRDSPQAWAPVGPTAINPGDLNSPPASSLPLKPQRVLACVRCQQRKIKCDRRFPCAHCNSSRSQCVPSTQTPRSRRKRRFPERELLDRLRKYEDLLRQNNIRFEPLHKDSSKEHGTPNTHHGDGSDNELLDAVVADYPSPSTTIKSERGHEKKDFWQAINSGPRDAEDDSDTSDEDMREVVGGKGWDQLFGENDHLLFGSSNTNVDLSTLHPEPVLIFKFWQLFSDNVNPLLKVIHAPSLQGRIIEAASNTAQISPTLEALMFAIYCVAVLSLVDADCQSKFGSSKENLSMRFRFGCQQALSNCAFLRSNDRECLTALHLYLISVRAKIVPQSLFAMHGVAIRVAQRMGISSEQELARKTPFEAELCRRLWWSLVLFDTRISELANYKTTTLSPLWDCKIPLNISDSDLRPEMKELPVAQTSPTDSLFIVMHSELGEFRRHSMFHLEFTNTSLKSLLNVVERPGILESEELNELEKMVEKKYLKLCDPDIPLHFLTSWWTRLYLAKCRFMEILSRTSSPSSPRTEVQQDEVILHALRMLECDTMITASPLTKGFYWLPQYYFPFPAYIQLFQDLKRRPINKQAKQAWSAMSDNYEARLSFPPGDEMQKDDSPFLAAFFKLILQAWDASGVAFKESGKPLKEPRIVLIVKQRLAQISQSTQDLGTMGIDTFWMTMPTSFDDQSLPYEFRGYNGQAGPSAATYNLPAQNPYDLELNHLNWDAMNWSAGGAAPFPGPPRPF